MAGEAEALMDAMRRTGSESNISSLQVFFVFELEPCTLLVFWMPPMILI